MKRIRFSVERIVAMLKQAYVYGDEFSTTGDIRLDDVTAGQFTEQLRNYQ